MNIAVIVNDLSPSQKTFYLVKAMNGMLDSFDLSPTVFQSRSCKPVLQTLFPCKMTAGLGAYHGVVISTTVEDAELSLKASNNTKCFLYLWELSWINTPMRFKAVMKILQDDRLNIIARSESHSSVIENFCNKTPVAILEDWEPNELSRIVSKDY
tara:strand:- start:12918 stop:13382 length:465 start_codon:yes stop_codon:yes gene_type:complete